MISGFFAHLNLLSRRSWFMWFAIIAMGCTSPTTSQNQENEITKDLSETSSLIDTRSVTTSPIIPTSSLTPQSTQTLALPTPTSSPLPTKTPLPTLTIEEEAVLVQELMTTNGGCQLPCWWGIELGDSLESVGQMFETLGLTGWDVTTSDLGDDGPVGYIVTGYFDTNASFYYVDVFLNFYTIDNRVQYIQVSSSRPLPYLGREEFVRDWQPYFLNSILQQYGRPTYVYLTPQDVGDPEQPYFDLALYYPELGLEITYTLSGTWLTNGEVEVCLALEDSNHISLSLYNPDLAETWSPYLTPPELVPEAVELYRQWKWDVQTGIDLDTFYETYKDPNNLRCIQVQ